MSMMYVGLGSRQTADGVLAFLRMRFPTFEIRVDEKGWGVDYDAWPRRCLLIEFRESKSEFPLLVGIDPVWPYETELCLSAMIELARQFHVAFGCPTICDGSGYGDVPGDPGDAIVWQDGKPYLADDYGTDFFDGEGGQVRIIRPIAIDLKEIAQSLHRIIAAAPNRTSDPDE